MLRATSAYVDYAFNDENSKARLNGLIESTKDEIMKIYVEEKGVILETNECALSL
jgi:hypothetical protein